jgi:ring-1,2-phenylacetyl-CoA epoxidase subunit PaaA
MWGMVLDLFGKSDSERSRGYLKWGLRLRGNEEARQRFIPLARAKLVALGLTAPPDDTGRKFS